MLPTLLLSLALAQPAPPVDPPKLPAELRVRPGRSLEIVAECPNPVGWFCPDAGPDKSCELYRTCSEDGRHRARFNGERAGRYVVYAYTAAGDRPSEPSACVVTVGDPPPPDLPPDAPPRPPEPALLAKFREAYAADPGTAAEKRAAAAGLSALYRAAVDVANDPDCPTADELARRVAKVAPQMAGTLLPRLRSLITEEVLAAMPPDRLAPLTPEGRRRLADALARIAAALAPLGA